jgi:type IV secretory pathway TraG/TraD family ATPase VirD4
MKRQHTTDEEQVYIGWNGGVRGSGKRYVQMASKDRRLPKYIIGKTGTGKSTLLENLIAQDIFYGRGVCVVDPHGELVEKIIKDHIPRHRTNDVVYFNPADKEFPFGINMLDGYDEKDRELAAASLVSVFRHIWGNSWGPRLEYVLYNTIAALLEYEGSTFFDVYRMLTEEPFRRKVVQKITDPVIKSFWQVVYVGWSDRYVTEAVGPVLNKVGQLLGSRTMRGILCQQKSTVDFAKIMNGQKIFLVNLSKGQIGESRSSLLGSIIVTKLYLSALSRQKTKEENREDFYLYVDEFQNFATDAFESILSEARKYRLNLTIAHQFLSQISPRIQEAVLGNAGTLLVFRVGSIDAERLAKEFYPYKNFDDLCLQANYEITYKRIVDGEVSKPDFMYSMPPINWARRKAVPHKVIVRSREVYSRKRKINSPR